MVWIDKSTAKVYNISFEHTKVLYIVSFYGNASKNPAQPETWLRQIQLDVLIYEAIVAKKLDFDYAPVSRMYAYSVQGKVLFKRRYMNISQEGTSAVQDLVSLGFLNTIKLLSEDELPTTAYQVSYRGSELLINLPTLIRLEVEEFVMGQLSLKRKPHPKNDLKYVLPDEDGFLLVTVNGYEERSGVTDTEGVSYVVTPYLPRFLRVGEEPMTDNAPRAWESADGQVQLKDELSEVIVLSQVNVLVVEWVPIGANQFCFLLSRTGHGNGFTNSIFTAQVDVPPHEQVVISPEECTSVRYLEAKPMDCLNIEAALPEVEGLKQIGQLGFHIRKDGCVHAGVRVEAIGNRLADDVSLDLLSRLLVDLCQDSTAVLDDLLSPPQRRLLDLTYRNNAGMRPKFRIIWAERVDPPLRAAQFLDRGELENELRQVINAMKRQGAKHFHILRNMLDFVRISFRGMQ